MLKLSPTEISAFAINGHLLLNAAGEQIDQNVWFLNTVSQKLFHPSQLLLLQESHVLCDLLSFLLETTKNNNTPVYSAVRSSQSVK